MPCILCIQETAEKKTITEEEIIKSNWLGMGISVGAITNRVTAMYDKIVMFDKDSDEYREIYDRIIQGQNFQQNSIDSVKGIEFTPMPKHWYSYRDCETEEDANLCVQSKPYFMIYRYSELQTEYKKYVTKVNTKSIKTFDVNIEGLKQKTELTEEEAEFLKYYYKLMPVSLAPSTMNRICWHIENSMNEHYDKLKSETVDYSKYRYKYIKKSKNITEQVYDIYHSYALAKTNKSGVDATIATKNYCTQALKTLGKDKQVLNDIIDLIKTNKTAKSFLWDCATEMMLNRLENLYDCNE